MSSDNIVETVRALFKDGTLLLRQEVSLAKAEAEEKIQQVQHGLIEIGAALVIALAALFVLVQAVVEALSNVLPPSIAALVVGIILAIAAYISLKAGLASLTPENLKPSRTLDQIEEDIDTVKEAT